MSKSLLIKDLRRSGISKKYLKTLGFKVLKSADCAEFLGRKTSKTLIAYKIPFFNIEGTQTSFARLRLLEGRWHVPRPGEKKKRQFKYNQRANTAPHLYFPPVFPWAKYMKDGKIVLPRLVVTEGEKKAVKACLMGIPCVALAGVYNFKSKKRGISLIKEFRLFDLSDTIVEICYDSDLNSNEFVREAMVAFSSELVSLKPKYISTVMQDGDSAHGKTGLDDFLLDYDSKAAAIKAFDALPREHDERSAVLKELDSKLLFSVEQDSFFKLDTRRFTTRRALQEQYGNQPKLMNPENPNLRILPIDLWFNQRDESTTVQRVTFQPTKPSIFRERKTDIHDSFNLWTPPSIGLVKGKPNYWIELFDHLTANLTEDEKKWFLQWFAYPIQNPGTKLFTASFMYSNVQGIGKNFLVYPFFQRIYGDSFTMVNGDRLLGGFNGWMAQKQFIFADEVYMPNRADRKGMIGKLNTLITSETLDINEKFQPIMTLPNYTQLYLTSNHEEAIPIDDTDRRLLVIHPPERRLANEFYGKMDAWARKEASAGQLYRYLMNDVDCSDFNPKAAAPKTKARNETVSSAADAGVSLIQQIINDPTSVLAINGKPPEEQLYTAAEIAAAINRYAQEQGYSYRVTAQMVSTRMRTRVTYREVRIRDRDKVVTVGLWALYNERKWKDRDNGMWAAEYRKHNARFKRHDGAPATGSASVAAAPAGATTH